ncbi:uncharacterized protein LOC134229710 [Saccostrea cucullata]|uniref:uncharacterized protein LOC134229710 n=1 Tax=Saccostrea cuccullata TaxID=36930 RepID=UPI002ED3B346
MTSERGKKRPRSDDCEECNPISKRINRLQIESVSNQTGALPAQNMGVCLPKTHPTESDDLHLQCRNLRIRSNSHDANQQTERNQPTMSTNNNLNSENPNCMACNMGQGDPYYQELMEGYDPELTAVENPHYFDINRLLFDAHASRAGRHRINFSNS